MIFLDVIDDPTGNTVKITRFPINSFRRDLKKRYKTSRISKIFDNTFSIFGHGNIIVHKFFLPELVYILSELSTFSNKKNVYITIQNMILEKTWMSNVSKNLSSGVNVKSSDFKYTLKSYQNNFIQNYDQNKRKYNLNGYILAFEQGLGKTFTSLALMQGLKKDAVIIIAPKSVLRTVWENEINSIFSEKQNIWIIGDKPKKSRFYIVNYESIEKLSQILPFVIASKRTGIIVDESHNFRNKDAKRVLKLVSIAKVTKTNDVLLMSGTPIKAMGTEMIPALSILDPLFDDDAKSIFVKVFGLSTAVASQILRNRLGMIMHRKMKIEVLNLPNKEYKEVKIKTSNSKEYTLENVKTKVVDYIRERTLYYNKNMGKYQNDFDEVIDYISKKSVEDSWSFEETKKFEEYKSTVDYLKKYGYNARDKKLVERVKIANVYEKEILMPNLPIEIKKKFKEAKSVIKYVNLKIMGEVIGGLLNRLRAQMYSDMIKSSPLCEIIKSAEKKTVCFTTYVDVVKKANEYVEKTCKRKPLLVYGETSSNIKSILMKFEDDYKSNPLIATIQTLSTGVTLIEANTIVFINSPWRHTDKLQAEDRVHRIGQDTDVKIYNFVLDTGTDPNLSTRMEDIVEWSKGMFEDIVGAAEVAKYMISAAPKLMGYK